MSRISRLDRSEVASEIAALYDKAFAQTGKRAEYVSRDGAPARNLLHHAGALCCGPQHGDGLDQTQRTQLLLSTRPQLAQNKKVLGEETRLGDTRRVCSSPTRILD